MAETFKELELLVAKIQKQLAPGADVLHNVHLDGRDSGVKRQIDVLVQEKIGQYEIKIIIDCKDYNKPADVNDVGAFQHLVPRCWRAKRRSCMSKGIYRCGQDDGR